MDPTAGEAVITAEAVTKVFGAGATEVRAVDNVYLSVAKGEILLIMGPSGSGKTTLLTMLGALLTPTSGRIILAGQDLGAATEAELARLRRDHVGFIFQSFNLLDALSAVDNVAVPLMLAGWRRHDARARASTILAAFGLTDRASFRPKALSGGERQRVSIGRALANDPKVLLADEPTANLDSTRGREVVLLLRDIARQQSRTVVIVSHDQRIRETADRVLWLEDGRLSEIGRLVRDPVCGMTVEPVGPSHALGGRTHFFCSTACRDAFADSPERYQGT